MRAVIVTGAGRAFCAGADLSKGEETFNYEKRGELRPDGLNRDGGGLVTLRIFASKKPVIAAINGPAVGFGATMTLPMDLRPAQHGPHRVWFTRRGVVPEACSSWFLPRLSAASPAMTLSFSRRGGAGRWVVARCCRPRRCCRGRKNWPPKSPILAVSVATTRQMMWQQAGASHPIAHRVDLRGMQQMATGRRPRRRSILSGQTAGAFSLRVSADMPAVFP